MQRYFVGFFLIFHGVIHWWGAQAAWGVDEVVGAEYEPWFEMSDLVSNVFGGVWFAAMLILAAAGVGVVMEKAWWKEVALFGVIVSTIAIIPYVADAALGLAANVIIVAILIGSFRGTLRLPE